MESARYIAYKILLDAAKRSTYSNIALDRELSGSHLSGADRALCSAIVLGVTERSMTLDAIIDALADRGGAVDSDARVLLRMGIYQIAYLDRIPDHAAVNETVSLAPRRLRGFVNAILRSYLRAKENGGLDALFPKKDEDLMGYLSMKYSFPKDICRRFCDIYGADRAERIFEVFNHTPPMTLRINTLKISRPEYEALLSERGIEYHVPERLPNAIITKGVSYSDLPGSDEGYFFVQDEASQSCVEALRAVAGDIVVDTCSCPGSKSFGIAIGMENRGRIYSFDLHKSKLSLIESGAHRLGIDIISVDQRDGRNPDKALFGRADKVLCDVPCSGLGVIAKKPEIRYKNISDFARLPEIQYDILSASVHYLKAGGILVYSTCTVLPEENEDNIKRFLAEHTDFEAVDFSVCGKSSSDGMLTLSPDTDNTDGFFIAKLRLKD